MTEMQDLCSSLRQCILLLPILNITVILVLIFACRHARSSLTEEEKEVFLTLAKYAPVIFISLQLYFLALSVLLISLPNLPGDLLVRWIGVNTTIVLLWLLVKFYYLRPASLKLKVASY